MKCTIIQDLLPLYCDKLTSPDSSEEIEKHLAECEKCREIYEDMSSKDISVAIPERDIKPLKTVKKKIAMKTVGIVLAVSAFLTGIFLVVFWGIIPISSKKVHYTVKAEETTYENRYSDRIEEKTMNCLWFEFDTDVSCCRFSNRPEYIYNDDGSITSHEHLYIYPQIKLPFDNRGKNPDKFGFGVTANKGDTLTIHYLDKEEFIDAYELYSKLSDK